MTNGERVRPEAECSGLGAYLTSGEAGLARCTGVRARRDVDSLPSSCGGVRDQSEGGGLDFRSAFLEPLHVCLSLAEWTVTNSSKSGATR